MLFKHSLAPAYPPSSRVLWKITKTTVICEMRLKGFYIKRQLCWLNCLKAVHLSFSSPDPGYMYPVTHLGGHQK